MRVCARATGRGSRPPVAHSAAMPPRKPRAARHPLRVPARVGTSGGAPPTAEVVDISASGLLLHASRRVRPLSAVEIELFVPILRRTLRLVGEAVRVDPLGVEEDAYAVGVRFTGYEPGVEELIRLIAASGATEAAARPEAPPPLPAMIPRPIVRTPAPVDLRVTDTTSGRPWKGRMRLSELGASHVRVLLRPADDADFPIHGDVVRVRVAVRNATLDVEGKVADARPLGETIDVAIVFPTLAPALQERATEMRKDAGLPVPRDLDLRGRR